MLKRRWKSWPGRVLTELNGVSGLAGLGGTAMGVAGWTILSGTAAAVLSGGGAVLAFGAFGYAIWNAVPSATRTPESLVGQILRLRDLKNVAPPVSTMAIVGASRAGKTTFKNRLSFHPRPNERTQSVTAHIVPIPKNPPMYIAILDGGGEKFSQQFGIVAPCDHLCIVIDHNSSDTESSVNHERLESHSKFLNQIRDHLVEVNGPRKLSIEILLNKRDLWESANAEEISLFVNFCEEEVRKWTDGNFAEVVKSNRHSNECVDDISRFMGELHNAMQQ